MHACQQEDAVVLSWPLWSVAAGLPETTTRDEKDIEDEGDMLLPLEGEDKEDWNLTSGVADCSAVRRERVESGTPMTCKKVARTNYMGKPCFYSCLPLPS